MQMQAFAPNPNPTSTSRHQAARCTLQALSFLIRAPKLLELESGTLLALADARRPQRHNMQSKMFVTITCACNDKYCRLAKVLSRPAEHKLQIQNTNYKTQRPSDRP